MIIVSQDKDEIVNFENMNNIIIEDYDIKDKHFQRIKANTDRDCFVLGDYKTEERAKEVLQDIIRFYIRTEVINKVYRMPKE